MKQLAEEEKQQRQLKEQEKLQKQQEKEEKQKQMVEVMFLSLFGVVGVEIFNVKVDVWGVHLGGVCT